MEIEYNCRYRQYRTNIRKIQETHRTNIGKYKKHIKKYKKNTGTDIGTIQETYRKCIGKMQETYRKHIGTIYEKKYY